MISYDERCPVITFRNKDEELTPVINEFRKKRDMEKPQKFGDYLMKLFREKHTKNKYELVGD